MRDSNVDVDTLANLCRRHAPATTHFLKIDVQGAERAVLAGADFKSFRPWIVLVEATTPISIAAAHGQLGVHPPRRRLRVRLV